jgi:hypothetical protein
MLSKKYETSIFGLQVYGDATNQDKSFIEILDEKIARTNYFIKKYPQNCRYETRLRTLQEIKDLILEQQKI